MRVDDNKRELFAFLSKFVAHNLHDSSKQLIVSYGSDVLSVPKIGENRLMPCSQEEADTRMLLHLADAGQQGLKRVMIRTVDTDVVVLAIALRDQLLVNEVWLAFGVGKNFRYIPVHDIVAKLDPHKCSGLLFFHAFTGCDTVSSFFGHAKKGAWDAWASFPEVTPAFQALSTEPRTDTISSFLSVIERFVVLLYDRTSTKDSVNTARKHLFAKKGRQIENLPPTQSALIEHIKRAALQGGYYWVTALQTQPNLPSPSAWGWTRVNDQKPWEPLWTSIAAVSQCCPELVSCQCKKGCKRCKCVQAALTCTALRATVMVNVEINWHSYYHLL